MQRKEINDVLPQEKRPKNLHKRVCRRASKYTHRCTVRIINERDIHGPTKNA